MKNIFKGVAVIALVAFIAWVFISAGNYNEWSASTCEDAGLTWVKEYPFGDYGCATIIPFDEVSKR